MYNNDFITVVNNATPCNKRFTRTASGLSKTPAATIYDASARTVRITDADAMATLLREVGEDEHATLILGYIDGTQDGTHYNLVSGSTIANMRGSSDSEGRFEHGEHVYYARLKANFSPSSWFVFDYDEPPGMPELLRSPDFQSWLGSLALIVPGLRDVGYVMLPSSSSRIIDNGILQSTKNKHMLIQAQDANDVERFGRMLFLHALQMGLGFSSLTKGGAMRRQSIFDPTTFSRERLLFEGKPIVVGEGLSVGPVRVEVCAGGRLDTTAVSDVIDKVDGLEVTRSSSGNYITLDHDSFTSDVEIDTKDHGTLTHEDYMDGDYGKIRCQSPFRASESMAAYLNMHETSGAAFLYDVGSQTKYLYAPSVDELFGDVLKKTAPPPAPVFMPPPAPPSNVVVKPAEVITPPPPTAAPALAIVAGTDIAKKADAMEEKFEQSIRAMRVVGPGTSEKLELVESVLMVVESLDAEDGARRVRWRSEVASASELLGSELKEITKAVKSKLKRAGKLSDETPLHRRPLGGWPDMSADDLPIATIENARYMFRRLGVKLRYNTMSKDLAFDIPWARLSAHSELNDAFTEIKSISRHNKLSADDMIEYARLIANNEAFNPVEEWIDSKPWDGIPRFDLLLDSMDCADKVLGAQLLRRWLLSAVAAVYAPGGVKAQGVLVLQGPQGAGKTSWLAGLCGDRVEFFKEGHHLNLRDKDTLILALSNWIVELGELDSMFKSKRQVEELKAFITSNMDELRKPYERAPGKWARRTVFGASVNPEQFLVDSTGDRRYWTLSVTRPRYMDMPDMQQLWAEVKTWFVAGEQINLNSEEAKALEASNAVHSESSFLEDKILNHYDFAQECGSSLRNAIQILAELGITNGDKKQRDEIHVALEKLRGEPDGRIANRKAWRLPPKRIAMFD